MSVLATESSVHGWSIEHLDEKTIAGLERRIDARFPVLILMALAGRRDEYGLQEKLPVPDISPAIEFVPDFPKLGYLLEFELLMQRHASVVR